MSSPSYSDTWATMPDEVSSIVEQMVTLMLSDLMGCTLSASESSDSTYIKQWNKQSQTLGKKKSQPYSIARIEPTGL